jgi:hypothetical protein
MRCLPAANADIGFLLEIGYGESGLCTCDIFMNMALTCLDQQWDSLGDTKLQALKRQIMFFVTFCSTVLIVTGPVTLLVNYYVLFFPRYAWLMFIRFRPLAQPNSPM